MMPTRNAVPDVSDTLKFDCKNAKGIYYASPFDCQSYYQCIDSNSPPAKVSCTGNLQFNPIMQKCDDPNRVANVRPECDNNSISLAKETLKSVNIKV